MLFLKHPNQIFGRLTIGVLGAFDVQAILERLPFGIAQLKDTAAQTEPQALLQIGNACTTHVRFQGKDDLVHGSPFRECD